MEAALQIVSGGVTLELGTRDVARLAAAPEREQIRKLRLCVSWGDDLSKAIAALVAIDLPAVEHVELIHFFLHGDHVRGIDRLAALPGLRAIRLDGCAIDAAGVAALAALPLLGRIRALSIAHADLTPAALKPLLVSPLAAHLEELDRARRRPCAGPRARARQAPARVPEPRGST